MIHKPSLLDIETFNKKREHDLEQEPSMLEEDFDTIELDEANESEPEVMNLVKAQKREMDRISSELAGAIEQLNVQKRTLDTQAKEIAHLKKDIENSINRDNASKNIRRADTDYNKELILKNIVKLIEEQGFSCNDVARLFRLEGFLPPSPYADWDDKVVEKLYAITRQ